jgi:hypothetical protein
MCPHPPTRTPSAGVISSAEIQQAVRSILPPAVGQGGERQAFRPFLPTAAKRARQLDKQTLKGKGKGGARKRATPAAAGAAAEVAAAMDATAAAASCTTTRR